MDVKHGFIKDADMRYLMNQREMIFGIVDDLPSYSRSVATNCAERLRFIGGDAAEIDRTFRSTRRDDGWKSDRRACASSFRLKAVKAIPMPLLARVYYADNIVYLVVHVSVLLQTARPQS